MEPEPEHCPGTQSEQAGKSAACAGCPNQSICSTQPKRQGPDPDLFEIEENLQSVKHRILILSGKGGVGKSTVASQLALLLASDPERTIGLLDVDICGPSQHLMMGVEGEEMMQSSTGGGLTPVFAGPHGNVCVASVAFLLEAEGEAVIWRGPRKTGLMRTFLRDVSWDSLDCLVVDTPPGTSDEHLALASMLRPITGALLVTGPQELAWQDVRKEAEFCKRTKIPILGLIQNMAGFECSACHTHSDIFPDRSARIRKWASEHSIPFVSIPLDPRVARSLDSGLPFVLENPESPVAAAYRFIVKEMLPPL